MGFIAERQVASILRSGRRSPWTEEPTLDENLAALGPTAEGPEPRIASKELLTAILARLPLELSAQGMQLFELLLVDDRSVADVVKLTGLSSDAVYAWKSRLGKRIRQLAQELEAETTATPNGQSETTALPRTPSRPGH